MHTNPQPESRNLNPWVAGVMLMIVLGAAPILAQDTAGVRKWTPTTAAADLRTGGHVVFLQHAATGESTETDSCSTPGILSDDERALASNIGKQFQRLEIPIARVLSSERCAARNTAELLDLGEVEIDADLNPVDADTMESTQIERLRRMVGMQSPSDSNILLVSHRSNINRLLKIDVQSSPGTLYSFRRIDGALSMVGSVKAEEWNTARVE